MKKILVGLLVCLVLAHAKLFVPIESSGDVKITDITPNVAVQGQGTIITVKGEGFSEDSKVTVNPVISDSSKTLVDFNISGEIKDIEIIKNKAFIITRDYSTQVGSLTILDLTNSTSPKILSTINTLTNDLHGLTIYEDLVYIAEGSMGVAVIDISNINNPIKVSTIQTNGDTYNIGSCPANGLKATFNLNYILLQK